MNRVQMGRIVRPLGGAALLVAAASTSGCIVEQRGPPPGSYVATCRDIQVQRGTLIADCLRSDGSVNRSALDLDRCRGGVENWEGQLVCPGSEHWHGGEGGGPYGR